MVSNFPQFQKMLFTMHATDHVAVSTESSVHSYVLLLVTSIFILHSHLHVRHQNYLFFSGFPIKLLRELHTFSCCCLSLAFNFFYMKAVDLFVTVNILKSSLHRFVELLVSSSALYISSCLIMPLPKTVSHLCVFLLFK